MTNQLECVLVVDDDPIVRLVAGAFFAELGVDRIHTAADGEEAVAEFDVLEFKPDLILLDLNMPNRDGIQLLRHFGERHFAGDIIVLSGENSTILDMACQLGRLHHVNLVGALSKPFNPDKLQKLLETNAYRPGLSDTESRKFSKVQLSEAIEKGQIEPFYQPKICTRTGHTLGVEALARWNHPDLGTVLPDFFIPLADSSGLIRQLTSSILARAIDDLRRWDDTQLDGLSLSVNLPPRLLGDVELLDLVEELVGRSNLERHRLIFEITENAVIGRNANSLEVLARLHMKGFKISLDDFGTGHANLENLRDFPFSELKIDQSFVQGAVSDMFSRTCLEACVELAAARNLRIVAEGVQSEAQLQLVASLGIHEVQGFLFARAMPFDEFTRWLAAKTTSISSLAS